MKKNLFFAALVAASMAGVQPVMAAPAVESDAVTGVLAVSDYEGVYNGTMDNITMNGKNYDSQSATYTLQGGMLLCNFPQIGSMPGTITIELAVEVDEATGEIIAYPGDYAGTLSLPLAIKVELTLDSLDNAVVTGNQIEFTLAVSGTFLGANFPASVHFVGTR